MFAAQESEKAERWRGCWHGQRRNEWQLEREHSKRWCKWRCELAEGGSRRGCEHAEGWQWRQRGHGRSCRRVPCNGRKLLWHHLSQVQSLQRLLPGSTHRFRGEFAGSVRRL